MTAMLFARSMSRAHPRRLRAKQNWYDASTTRPPLGQDFAAWCRGTAAAPWRASSQSLSLFRLSLYDLL